MAQLLTFFFFLLVTVAESVRGAGAGVGLVPPVPIGKRYIVGAADGWRVPPQENKDMYIKWASTIQFFVEDSIEFMYKNDSVGEVNKYAYYHCNWTALAPTPPVKDGSSLFLLDAPGFAYFASADVKHCKKGQRLMLNVKARSAPVPSTDISSPPSPASPAIAPGPAPGEPVMDSATAALASSHGRAFMLVVSGTTLALMGTIRA
ncbi:hypothetical protein CFC21_103840 [Triticum aestivum]|uniref:Phytocyanin domain-containing protein n=2 Tax=Triticum aestivum TaxID=4565 RepID=A0A3B6SMY9_WHEAT|nr:early nodulin-like protein 1 [Triticum aestivum]KAF7102768.1 hypothetical protein CFC21_103840 [Triticum aestivum]